jgi:pimeloyl-ACP methyl ester carboxylesterase
MEYELELDGRVTRALELEGEGPPLLLLHGFADSADTWRRVLDRLARVHRRALAIDLPGFGAGPKLDRDEPILAQLDSLAAAAVLRLAAEDGEAVVISGNSLGGCVALRLGERKELPVCGVVPVAPAGFDHPVWFRLIEAHPVIRLLLTNRVPLPEPIVRALVGEVYRQLAFAHPRAMEPEVIRVFTSHHRTPGHIRGYLDVGRRLMSELRDPFRLADVRVPVLLVWGDRDRMVTHRGSRHVLEALPATTYELLPGCGHCPQIEEADRLVELLLEFLPEPKARAA